MYEGKVELESQWCSPWTYMQHDIMMKNTDVVYHRVPCCLSSRILHWIFWYIHAGESVTGLITPTTVTWITTNHGIRYHIHVPLIDLDLDILCPLILGWFILLFAFLFCIPYVQSVSHSLGNLELQTHVTLSATLILKYTFLIEYLLFCRSWISWLTMDCHYGKRLDLQPRGPYSPTPSTSYANRPKHYGLPFTFLIDIMVSAHRPCGAILLAIR